MTPDRAQEVPTALDDAPGPLSSTARLSLLPEAPVLFTTAIEDTHLSSRLCAQGKRHSASGDGDSRTAHVHLASYAGLAAAPFPASCPASRSTSPTTRSGSPFATCSYSQSPLASASHPAVRPSIHASAAACA